jgi:hypothetical protein
MISPCAAGCGNQRAAGRAFEAPELLPRRLRPRYRRKPSPRPRRTAPEPRQRIKNQEEDDDFLGIPNPPSKAANGCFEAVFCGAEEAAASSILRTEEGDGS